MHLLLSKHRLRGYTALLLLVGLVMVGRWLWPAAERAAPLTPTQLVALAAQEDSLRIERLAVEINMGDSAAFEALPGIGPVTARRIIRYRDKAGCFGSLAHFRKVWGIDSLWPTIAPYIRFDSSAVPQAEVRSLGPKQDLNTLTEAQLTAMGIMPAWLAERLLRYRASLGGFTRWAQVAQAYDLRDYQLRALQARCYLGQAPGKAPVDLNTADSSALEALPGLGPVLSARIIKYRNLLGFYHSLEQLHEVYGLKPEHYEAAAPRLTIGQDLSSYPHIAINGCVVEELGRHPYISWAEARLVLAYRQEHGPFANEAALAQVRGLQPETRRKLLPYLVFN